MKNPIFFAISALASISLVFCIAARAAEMRVVSGSSDGTTFITIQGEFVLGDDRKFITMALPLEKATVVLNSDGGSVMWPWGRD